MPSLLRKASYSRLTPQSIKFLNSSERKQIHLLVRCFISNFTTLVFNVLDGEHQLSQWDVVFNNNSFAVAVLQSIAVLLLPSENNIDKILRIDFDGTMSEVRLVRVFFTYKEVGSLGKSDSGHTHAARMRRSRN